MIVPVPSFFDPARAALVVIDMQNDFCAPNGFLALRKGYDVAFADGVADRIEALLPHARAALGAVVWVRSHYDFRYLNSAEIAKRGEEGCCMEGSAGADFYRLVPMPDEAVVTKHHFDGFHDTDLDAQLRGRGIDTLVLCGVATNVCVESTLRSGFFRGYHVLLLDDCTGSGNRAGHDGTIATVRTNFGTVLSSADMVAALAGGMPTATPPPGR
ncbi:cysteine hydrolase family protein [Sphingobium sp.]|uniref:cysteine hydrolase family protein n=1 Tax=Sphingobium sp. TaxID=1912891 RepID=UPI003B3A8736